MGGGGGGCDDGPARSSLSMLHYAGATALGGQMGGGNGLPLGLGSGQQGLMAPPLGGPSGGMGPGSDSDAQAMQKRRFVWTADLHSRFEAAVNALGLDNAKPKSILKVRARSLVASRSLCMHAPPRTPRLASLLRTRRVACPLTDRARAPRRSAAYERRWSHQGEHQVAPPKVPLPHAEKGSGGAPKWRGGADV